MMRAPLLALVMLFAPIVHAQEYCLALRGNGELMPAHWGAMANLVEKIGMPKMQAGGSSASITLMMNEAVATNKFVKSATGQQRNLRAALLYKSFEGFLEYLMTTPEWRDFITLYKRGNSAAGMDWVKELNRWIAQAAPMSGDELKSFLAQNIELIKGNYRTGVRLGLISQKNYAPLLTVLGRLAAGEMSSADQDVVTAKFYAEELRETIRVFGAFNAKTDANLFFRPGLIDFSRLGEQFGRMAQFYATEANKPADDAAWEQLFRECEGTTGLLWTEIASAKPECTRRFQTLVQAHFSSVVPLNFADRIAGQAIPSFPTTSVIVGAGVAEVKAAFVNYAQSRDQNFGFGFFLSHPEDVRFGYWGTLEAGPDSADEKSRRFLPLGEAKWKTILGLSPAEPGLASLQPFRVGDVDYVSAGGWSDLHPVLVLKAAGCERVVYVTRRGGESPFAQGVAKRLLSRQADDPEAEKLLSVLYDLKNPVSAFRKSLDRADAVLCTDWNRFEIKQGVKDMIRDSYRSSPYFIRNRNAFSGAPLLPQLNPKDETADGKLVYEGCF